MSVLRSTVVMKTDIYEYTSRTRELSEAELSNLLTQHKHLVADLAVRNEGSIIKGEGDSFWLIFPSVTAAALAAVAIQQELRAVQTGLSEAHRISIRVSIALGDVLHQDNDIFGVAVNLAARIESVTPPDEIYLSQSAWLALNKAELRTTFVNDFTLKGFADSVKVYRIEQKHRTRIVRDQTILFLDISGFSVFYDSHSVSDSEAVLLFLDEITLAACDQYGGIVRQILGDAQVVTFAVITDALPAAICLCQRWHAYATKNDIACGLRIGLHYGDVNIFRSHLYGHSVNLAASLASMGRSQRDSTLVIASQEFKAVLDQISPEPRLRPLTEGCYLLDLDFKID